MALNEAPGGGVPVGTPQAAPPAAQGTNILAVIGLVAGILGLLTSWVTFLGVVLSAIGLVLAIIGKKNASVSGGGGVAMGGLIVSIIGLLLSLTMTACQLACSYAVKKGADEAKLHQGDWEKAGKDLDKEFKKAMDEAQKAQREAKVPADMDKEFKKAAEEVEKARKEAEKAAPADDKK